MWLVFFFHPTWYIRMSSDATAKTNRTIYISVGVVVGVAILVVVILLATGVIGGGGGSSGQAACAVSPTTNLSAQCQSLSDCPSPQCNSCVFNPFDPATWLDGERPSEANPAGFNPANSALAAEDRAPVAGGGVCQDCTAHPLYCSCYTDDDCGGGDGSDGSLTCQYVPNEFGSLPSSFGGRRLCMPTCGSSPYAARNNCLTPEGTVDENAVPYQNMCFRSPMDPATATNLWYVSSGDDSAGPPGGKWTTGPIQDVLWRCTDNDRTPCYVGAVDNKDVPSGASSECPGNSTCVPTCLSPDGVSCDGVEVVSKGSVSDGKINGDITIPCNSDSDSEFSCFPRVGCQNAYVSDMPCSDRPDSLRRCSYETDHIFQGYQTFGTCVWDGNRGLQPCSEDSDCVDATAGPLGTETPSCRFAWANTAQAVSDRDSVSMDNDAQRIVSMKTCQSRSACPSVVVLRARTRCFSVLK